MRGSDIMLCFFIISVFLALLFYNIIDSSIQKIKDNWPLYRCNPGIIPFAKFFGHDPGENFTYCIANMQSGFMQFLLAPVYYLMSVLIKMGIALTESLAQILDFSNIFRFNLFREIDNIFGIVYNIFIAIQRILINIIDTIRKTIGLISSVFYMIISVILMLGGIWNGTVGNLIRKAAGFACFHRNTMIELNNGEKKKIKDITLKDTLKNNNKVTAIMKINNDGSPFYKLDKIYVTGKHLVKYNNRFIHVDEHPDAFKTKKINKTVYCLVTEKHIIEIDNHIFGDWEDVQLN